MKIAYDIIRACVIICGICILCIEYYEQGQIDFIRKSTTLKSNNTFVQENLTVYEDCFYFCGNSEKLTWDEYVKRYQDLSQP